MKRTEKNATPTDAGRDAEQCLALLGLRDSTASAAELVAMMSAHDPQWMVVTGAADLDRYHLEWLVNDFRRLPHIDWYERLLLLPQCVFDRLNADTGDSAPALQMMYVLRALTEDTGSATLEMTPDQLVSHLAAMAFAISGADMERRGLQRLEYVHPMRMEGRKIGFRLSRTMLLATALTSSDPAYSADMLHRARQEQHEA